MKRSKTSASNLFRRVLCVGSEFVESDLADVSSKYSDSGSDLHRLKANPSASRNHLSDADLELLASAERLQSDFMEWLNAMFPDGLSWSIEREFNLPLFSGTQDEMISHPDFMATARGVVAVTDDKFGRIEVDPASDNWQIATYLCGAQERFPEATTFVGAIIQPMVSGKIAPVVMSRDEVLAIREQIKGVLAACKEPDAPLSPSVSACRYCKGALLGVCPARHEFALAPVKSSAEIAIRDPQTFLLSLTADKRTQLLDALSMAVDMNDAIRKAARSMLKEDPTAIPGYSVKPDTETRKIVDITAVWQALSIKGITHSELLAAVSMPITNTTKLYKKATGLKGKELEEAVEKFLDPLCDKVPRAGNLERE